MFHLVYHAATGQILHAYPEGDVARVRPPAGPQYGRLAVDDDVPANAQKLRLLLKSLAPPPTVRPGLPRPPRPWRVNPATGRVLNSQGVPVTFDANPERAALAEPLPGGKQLLEALGEILADPLVPPWGKTLARITIRLLRRQRDRDGGTPED